MYLDGVKIEVTSLNGACWLALPMLEFKSVVNEATGELLSNTRVAIYKGLRFSITQSKKNTSKYYYSVRGSLPKYWNNGKHNAVDFDFNTFKLVVKDLQDTFSINPETSIIHNLEIGVNIRTKTTAKKVINKLIASKNSQFFGLKMESVTVGKRIDKQRYKLKIYDKGLQSKTKDKHLLRIELSIKKMDYLKNYNIKTLSDLLCVDKIKPLGGLLLNEWDNVLFYDNGIKWREMSVFEQKKFLYYLTPNHWIEFDKKQRTRAKHHFNKLLNVYGTSKTKDNIYNSIAQKWEVVTAEMCTPLNHDLSKIKEVDLSTFDLLVCTVQTCTNEGMNLIKKNNRNKHLKKAILFKYKKRKCKCCKIDISHKKASTKYCSKSCNNKINGLERTKKRIEKRKQEQMNLLKLGSQLKNKRLILAITYGSEKENYTDTLFQNEINAPPDWIKKVNKTIIEGYRKNIKPVELTGIRARKLIRLITELNIKK